MSKEYWIQGYEEAIEEIAEDKDISYDEAEVLLDDILEKDPRFLDGYLTYDYEDLNAAQYFDVPIQYRPTQPYGVR